jgi:hypothetical protein
MKRVAIVLAAILATTGTVLGAEISVSGVSVGGVMRRC